MTDESGIRGIEHVSIAVTDVDAALATYAGLGFVKQWTEDLEDQGIRSHVLKAGDVSIEILERVGNKPEGEALARFLERHGEGVHHVCLEVANLDAAIARAKSAGLRLVRDRPVADGRGRRVFVHPASLHGVLTGLVELHEGNHDSSPDQAGERRDAFGATLPEFSGRTFVAAVARHGRPLFISGLNAMGDNGRVEPDTLAGQAQIIFHKLDRILTEAGAGPEHVVKTTDYIVTRAGYSEVAAVRRDFFKGTFPAATGVVVSELLGRGVLIEMDAVAVI